MGPLVVSWISKQSLEIGLRKQVFIRSGELLREFRLEGSFTSVGASLSGWKGQSLCYKKSMFKSTGAEFFFKHQRHNVLHCLHYALNK